MFGLERLWLILNTNTAAVCTPWWTTLQTCFLLFSYLLYMCSCELGPCILSESLVTLKKTARAVCDNESLWESVRGSCDERSGRGNKQATPSPSPHRPSEMKVYFRRPHLQHSSPLTDTVYLARTVACWNSQGQSEITNTGSPQTSAKNPKSSWIAVM